MNDQPKGQTHEEIFEAIGGEKFFGDLRRKDVAVQQGDTLPQKVTLVETSIDDTSDPNTIDSLLAFMRDT